MFWLYQRISAWFLRHYSHYRNYGHFHDCESPTGMPFHWIWLHTACPASSEKIAANSSFRAGHPTFPITAYTCDPFIPSYRIRGSEQNFISGQFRHVPQSLEFKFCLSRPTASVGTKLSPHFHIVILAQV